MVIRRPPRPSLRPFVQTIWALDQKDDEASARPSREHVLPTGGMHLVFRLNSAPLIVFEDDCKAGRTVGHAVVGGARSRFYVRDVSTAAKSVGAMLRPGAAQVLFGVSAEELSERHTRLEDLWGTAAESSLQMLHDAGEPEEQLDQFELLLASRLPVVHGIHPAVAFALERFDATGRVDAIVKQSGYSHRHFVALFRRTVGLAPKTYSRVRRFRHALRLAAGHTAASWSRIALDAGYSDQAHFHREFLSFTGVTPAAYRRINPVQPSHVAPPGTNTLAT